MYNVKDIRKCPALLQLLGASSTFRTNNSKQLATILIRSRHTLDNEWEAICEYYEVDSREAAFWAAVDDGIAEPMSRRSVSPTKPAGSPP